MSGLALGSAGVYSPEYGQVLDGNAMRFAQILADYNPYFQLEFIPERERGGEAPYRVVNRTPGIPQTVVRYITHEEMSAPQKVLAAIWAGDAGRRDANDILLEMELEETAARMLQLKQQEEKALEAEELVAFYVSGGRDRKHYLNFNGHKIER